ncbi:MAG: diguanylate cyclase [Nitrospiraceae bacterium]|nr:MAG: diguanylate cyclase [Nitrospiraceae bacterium]
MKIIKLKTRILLITVSVAVLLGIATMILVKTALYRKLFITLQKRGVSIARHIAEGSVDPILTKKFFDLEIMVRDIKDSEEEIEYIFVLNDRGEVLAHTFEGGFPSDLKGVNAIPPYHSYSVLALETGNRNILDIAAPILKGEIGVIHLGVSEESLRKDINEIVRIMGWIITAGMAGGIIAAIIFSRTISKPVSELVKGVGIVGRGDLDHRVPVNSNDEIGQLAVSFNDMTLQLKKRTDELERINSELSILQVISMAAASTMKLDELFAATLSAVTSFNIFKVENKGVIFLVDGEKMSLVSQTGFPESFLEAHKGIKVGDCLCGLAAKTREIVVSGDSETNGRHTITYPEITRHGQICIPLEARNRILGVLCLYPAVGIKVSEREMALLYTIGSRIGAAIDNIMLYEETKSLALHDPLTGLANRRLMDFVMETLFARAKRAECPFSAIMLDIDFFKNYNDTYGHTFGDQLLVDIAGIISKEIRQIDLGVRYGGEEFLVLLPETGLPDACEVAERIRKEVELNTRITISLGVTCYNHKMQKKENIIGQADEALLQAKRKGKNRVEVSI